MPKSSVISYAISTEQRKIFKTKESFIIIVPDYCQVRASYIELLPKLPIYSDTMELLFMSETSPTESLVIGVCNLHYLEKNKYSNLPYFFNKKNSIIMYFIKSIQGMFLI